MPYIKNIYIYIFFREKQKDGGRTIKIVKKKKHQKLETRRNLLDVPSRQLAHIVKARRVT